MNIKRALEQRLGAVEGLRLNDIDVDPRRIRAILINEVVPDDPSQDFYGPDPAGYGAAAVTLFQKAGLEAADMRDILQMGVYITNAVKTPKRGRAIEQASLEQSSPYLEAELSLFPDVRVILLMGDVAKKAFNRIAKKAAGRNAVPAGSTYRLRKTEIYFGGVRVLPSYIMTGGNLLIEKSKVEMAAEDIAAMARLIRG